MSRFGFNSDFRTNTNFGFVNSGLAFNPLNIDGLQLYLNKDLGVNTKLAADFNGVNQYLSSGSADFDKTTQSFTFGAWAKFDVTSPTNTIISKSNTTSNQRGYILQRSSVDSIIRLGLSQDGITFNSIGSTVLSNSVWYFIVGVFDSVNQLGKISVNGGSFESMATTSVFNSTADFLIGGINGGNAMDGQVDGAFFYNKALSLAEIQGLYNSGSGLPYDSLTDAQRTDNILWAELNETSGTRFDSSPSNNNLTDNGGVSYALGKIQEPSQVGDLVSQWIDQSPNMFVLSQDTVTAQPVLSANSIDFDGVNDSLNYASSNVFGGDSSGIIFVSYYWDGVSSLRFLSSADNSIQTAIMSFSVTGANGRLTVSSSNTEIVSGVDSSIVGFNRGWIKSTGTEYIISLNGVIQTITIVSGTNSGDWFADVPSRDNLTIGSVLRLTPFYTPTKSVKIIYSNANLSASQIAKIDNFMSQP